MVHIKTYILHIETNVTDGSMPTVLFHNRVTWFCPDPGADAGGLTRGRYVAGCGNVFCLHHMLDHLMQLFGALYVYAYIPFIA